MKTLRIVLVILLLSEVCYGQQDMPRLSEVLKTAINLYDNNNTNFIETSKPDSIVITNDFDFSNFKIIKCDVETKKHFEITYEKRSIKYIERIDSLNDLYNYKFAVLKKNGNTYLHGIGGGDFLKGVIVVLGDLKSVYYIQLSDDDINKNSNFYRVSYIMKLTDNLLPLYKVYFYNEYIAYISHFKYQGVDIKIVMEEMYLPLIDQPTLSSSLNTLQDLEKIYLNKTNFYLLGSLKPDIRDNSLPVWFYGNYSYK